MYQTKIKWLLFYLIAPSIVAIQPLNVSAGVFKKCQYIAQYQDGRSAGVMKSGSATKMSKACAEARKRCEKKLKKLYKKGKLERGAVCYKYGGEVH